MCHITGNFYRTDRVLENITGNLYPCAVLCVARCDATAVRFRFCFRIRVPLPVVNSNTTESGVATCIASCIENLNYYL